MIEKTIGKHSIRIENDMLFCYLRGPCSLDEGLAYLHEAEAILAAQDHCYMATDVSQLTALDPAIRRFVTDWYRRHRRIHGCAVFGADVATRALVTLLVRAINLVGKNQLQVRFVNTEAEARSYIDSRRKQLESEPA